LRIEEVVDLALKSYPSIHVADAQVDVAHGGVSTARTAYLPRTDLVVQENRATRNNVAGLLLPQGTIPSISGPVAPTSYGGMWGSAMGALFSWEPFDFGLRRANVNVAERLVSQATAGADVTRLQIATRAADAFLIAVAADELVRTAQANVDRLSVFATSVGTLVQNQLRPGADASRAEAELAAARIQLLRSQLAVTTARATVAEMIGLAGESVAPDAGEFVQKVPAALATPDNFETHPVAQAQEAAVAIVRSREDALARAYAPRVNLQSSIFARGAAAPGIATGSGGLWPNTSNWAVGLTFSFPVFDIAGVHARRAVELGAEAVERARYDQTLQTLHAQQVRTTAALDTARQIVEVIPVELRAAREAESRARARYEAGLATLTDVADAQRLLAQAEVDDALARLGVWQALLAEANARGTLAPFLDRIK
jgi:outer membrane protein TolC